MSDRMILLHGVGLDRNVFEPLRAALGIETHAYDLRGSGEGPRWVDAASLPEFASDLWAEADALGWEQFALCGFSMGAMIAQFAALDQPERISHLILLNPVFDRSAEQRAGVAARLETAMKEGPSEIIDAALTRWFPAHFAPDALVASTRKRLETNDSSQFLKNYALFAEADQALVEKVDGITCPSFVATGSLDTGSTPEMTTNLAAKIPAAEAKIYEDAAHFLPLQFPKELAQDILDWMERS